MNDLECSITELTIEDAHSKAYHTNAKVFNGDLDKHAVKDYYSKWAEEYDDHLSPERYDGPSMAAESCAGCFAEADRENVVVLDVAAGTGRVGLELLQRGFCNIHALDPAEGMLEIAKSKNIYRKFLCEFLTADKLPVNEGTYDCVTSSGGMGDGHIPSEALYEMIRITKPGGYIVTVMREEYLEGPEYKDKLENLMHKLEKQGKWKRIERSVVPNYAFNKTGVIFRYKVL